MLTIGDKIKYFRKQRGLTQAQLADLAGIHPVSIRKYETNKMQPQSAQIERIAEALRVSSGAISESHSEIIHLETKGDLMDLLMIWHKSGILHMKGKRGDDNLLDSTSVQFVLNPVFEKHMTLSCVEKKKEETIKLDSLNIALQDSDVLNDLLRWESLYNSYALMSAKYRDTGKEHIKTALDELRKNLELIEMELQGSVEPLK